MANSDGQVVIGVSMERSDFESDLDWLKSNLENLGNDFSADEISEKIEKAMQESKSSVDDAIDDINSKKAKPKIGADDTELDEKAEESKDKLKSVSGIRATAKLKADAEDLLEKAENSKSALKKLPKSVRTEIIAQAQEAGIVNFEKLINKLPKEVKTQLIADVRDGKLINFEQSLKDVPKEKLTKLEVNDQASGTLKKMTTNIEESDNKAKGFTSTLKGTALGMGIYQTAMAAGQLVTKNLGDAIDRVDTLNNSKRVFENMGYSAQETTSAMNDLNKSILGLPTPLDKAVQGVQMIAATTNNLGQAQKVWSALNDAIIGFGGSTDQVNEATIQLSQAFSNGKVDGQTWISMMNAGMGPALNAIAKQMGITTGKLKDGLSGGTISVEQFQNKLIELDTKGGGSLKSLHQIAKDSTSGIKTSMANAGTAVTRGLADVVVSFSNMLKSITGSNLSEIIQNMGSRANKALEMLASAFSKVPAKIKPLTSALSPLSGLIKPLAPMITTFAASLTALTVATAVASGLSKVVGALASFSNPVTLAVSALAALVVGFTQLYTHNSKFKKFVDDVVKNISNLIKNITNVAKSITKDFVGAFNKVAEPVKKAFSNIWKYIQPDLKTLEKNISSIMKSIQNTISTIVKAIQKIWDATWKQIQKIVTPILQSISKFVSQHMNQIKNIINSVTKIISTIWNTIWKQVENVFKLVWDAIFHKSKVIQDIKNIIDTQIKAIQKIWQQIWKIIQNYFDIVWDEIKDIAKSAINWVKNIIDDVINTIQSIWKKIWNSIKDFFGDIWDGIKNTANKGVNWVKDTLSSILGSIKDNWNNMWQSMSDFFGSIWKDIKKYAQDGINGVINVINAGIDGIDAVWKFFTGKETSIHHLSPVKFAQGGIVDRHLSMVNDGDGADWKELIETPDGDLMMSNERNAVLPLEPGTRVYNGSETRQIMSMLGVDHYANGGFVGGIQRFKDGGVVGDLIDWGAHELKNFGSWIKDKWDAVTKFLKHPLENTKEIIKKAITAPLNKLENSNMVSLGKGVFDKLTSPISKWFEKGLKEAKQKHDEETSAAGVTAKNIGAGAKNWTNTIKKVAKEMKVDLSDSDLNLILWRINKESGGDQSIKQQVWDVNMANGTPAQGLLQYVPSTFASWMVSGHTNILSGEDQLYAMFNDSNWRHDIANSGGWGPTGHRRYDNGGVINQPELAWLAEKNREFVINPQRNSADSLLQQAAEERLAYEPNSEIAQAISGMNAARANNGTFVSNSIMTGSNVSTASTASNNKNTNGVGNIYVELDGKTIAQASYPYQKVIQGQDIMLQNRIGGAVFG